MLLAQWRSVLVGC